MAQVLGGQELDFWAYALLSGEVFLAAGVCAVLLTSAEEKVRADLIAAIPDFTPSVTFTEANNGKTLSMDTTNNKFAVITGAVPTTRVYSFDKLVAVEVFKNRSSIRRTDRGSRLHGAAGGGIMPGPVGLLFSGLPRSRWNDEKIGRLSLKIFTNDIESRVEEIVFVDAGAGGANHIRVRDEVEQLYQWHGRFQVILYLQDKAQSPLVPVRQADATCIPTASGEAGFG